MTCHPFADPAVKAVFDRYPPILRERLLQLRSLIFDAAKVIEKHCPLVETVKWGQPSYLPARPRIGTTVRIDRLKGSADHYALYFHCQTMLVPSFRSLYPDCLTFEGNRAILLSLAQELPAQEVRHCIAMALCYHLKANSF
jgi:hypothetical protein